MARGSRVRTKLLAGGRAEQPRQRPAGRMCQLADRRDTDLGEFCRGHRADAPHQVDRQAVQELQFCSRIDLHHAVGLGDLRGDLRQMFRSRHADGDRQAEFITDPSPDLARDLFRRAEQVGAAGDVGKGLVDGGAFDKRREIAEHRDRGIAEPLVFLEIAADEDELRAELARLPPRHAAMHAEGLGFVGRGEHHATADGNRLAAQEWIEQLLDRRVEGVEIGVQDCGGLFHVACCEVLSIGT